MGEFKIHSKFKPTGDQPQAINKLVDSIKNNNRGQTLLGVTGSGKTFTMANIIQELQRPTIILAHNKTIDSESEAYSIMKENLYNAVLKIKDSNGIIKDIEFRHTRNTRLGMLLVPRSVEKEDVIPIDDSSFKSVLSALKSTGNKEKCKYEENKTEQDKENK